MSHSHHDPDDTHIADDEHEHEHNHAAAEIAHALQSSSAAAAAHGQGMLHDADDDQGHHMGDADGHEHEHEHDGVGAGIDIHEHEHDQDPDLDKDWTDIASPFLDNDFYGAQTGVHEHGHVQQDATAVHDNSHAGSSAEHAAHTDAHSHGTLAYTGVTSMPMNVGMQSEALGQIAQHLHHHQNPHLSHAQPLGVGVGLSNITGAGYTLPSASSSRSQPLGIKRSRSPSVGTAPGGIMHVPMSPISSDTEPGGEGDADADAEAEADGLDLDVDVGLTHDASGMGAPGSGIGVGVGAGMGNVLGVKGEPSGTTARTGLAGASGSGGGGIGVGVGLGVGPSSGSHTHADGTTTDTASGLENGAEDPVDPSDPSAPPPNKRKRGPRAMRNKPPMQYWTDPSIEHLNLPATYEGRAIEYSRDANGENGPVFVHPAPGTVQACIRCHTIKRKCDALEFDNATQVWTKAKCSGCEKSKIPCVFELAAASSG